MHRRKRIATIGLASVCAFAGAAAGIAESSAVTKSSTRRHATHSGIAGLPDGPRGFEGHGMAVHSVEAVLNKAGTAFITETRDSGTITAVDASGGTVTIKEGTSTVTYATPAIAIPSGATVLLDGATSSLDKLAVGDHVSVGSSSDGTTVFATDASFASAPHGFAGPGGPPPGRPGGWG